MRKALFILAGLVVSAVVVFSVIDRLTGEGCKTALCCEECDILSVTRIIDGDTFVSDMARVRLYGVNAPERGQPCFRESTDRLRSLAGRKLRTEPGPRSTDRHGRLLYYTYTGSGSSIEEKLVSEGLVRAWTEDGQHRDHLTKLEAEARLAGRGCLWR